MTLFSAIRTKLLWDPKNVNSNARQLTESCVAIMGSVEKPLGNDVRGLPEMPPAVAIDVQATLSHTLSQIQQERGMIARLATRLQRQTNHVVRADKFKVDLPWYQDAVMAIDGLPEAARGVPVVGGYLSGLSSGTGDMAQSLGTLGGIALENNRYTGNAYKSFLGHLGHPSPTQTTVDGLKYNFSSRERAKAALAQMVRYDLLKEKRFDEWAGYMTPGAVLSALTGGAGVTTRVNAVTKVHKTKIPAPRPSRAQAATANATAFGKHGVLGALDAFTVGVTDVVLTLKRLWTRLDSRSNAQRRVDIADRQLAKAPDELVAAQQELQVVRGQVKVDRPKFRRRLEMPQGDHFLSNAARLKEWQQMMKTRLKNAESKVQQAQLHLERMPQRTQASRSNLNRQQQLLAAQIHDDVIHHSIHGILRVESFASALNGDRDDD